MQLSTLATGSMSAAKSPEEAAAIFKAGVTKALAAVLAAELDNALQSLTAGPAALSPNPSIAGWENLVGGLHVDLGWERPLIASVLPSYVTAFSPYPKHSPSGAVAIAANLSIGISISGTF